MHVYLPTVSDLLTTQAVLVAAFGITFLPLAIITALVSIPATIGLGIPLLLGLMLIALPLVTMAAMLWASYQVARWAYGAVVRVPVGSGNDVRGLPGVEPGQSGGQEVRTLVYTMLLLGLISIVVPEHDAKSR